MPTYFQRPENALKRANEFIDVGKKQRALDALYDVIKSKKHRTWQKIHEPIMNKYLELCVDLKKSHVAKEGLFQYRNICQQVNIKSLEDVVRGYLQLAEEKTEAAREESQQAVVDIDDLDNLQTPESLLMSAVSGEDAQDRTDRVVLTPWVKFLWESYRQCLELLRNNSRVERLYHDIAQQAFRFCLKYSRKTEFRKLCDNLRTHLSHIHKHQNQQTAINLNNPESQAMHLETRLCQLDSAIQMELWQEAYKAIEDIHGLMTLSKKPPKPQLMANYYQKLALVFWKAGNFLFHASALFRLFHLSRELKKNLTPEEIQRMASRVLLATLAIPIPPSRNEIDKYLETDENTMDKQRRLATLLSLSSPPSRSQLIKDLVRFNVIQYVVPHLQELYRWLEVEFHPLKLCCRVQQCFEFIQKSEELNELQQYVVPLQDVTLTRLLKQVSQVYQTIQFSRLVELAPFADVFYLERVVVDAAKNNDLQVRIDHRSRCLNFGMDLCVAQREDVPEGPHLQSMPSEQIRNQLINMSSVLHRTVKLIQPPKRKIEQDEMRQSIFTAYHNTAKKKHLRVLARRQMIEERKEMLENMNIQREEEERRHLEEQRKKQMMLEEERLQREADERERQRRLEEHKEIKRKHVKDKIEQLKKTGCAKFIGAMDEEELEKLDADEIMAKQVEQLDRERKELQSKLKSQEKKVDHLERAKRLEEIPLLKVAIEEKLVQDRKFWEQQEEERIAQLLEERQLALQHRERLTRIKDDKEEFLEKLRASRMSVYKTKQAEFEVRLQEERKKRLLARKEERKRERREKFEKERAEEEQRKAEEALKRAHDEEEAEREAKQAAEAAAYLARKEELERMAAKQRAREAEIEERERRQQEEERALRESSRRGADPIKTDDGDWRRKGDVGDREEKAMPPWKPNRGDGAPTWREREKAREDSWRPRKDEADLGDKEDEKWRGADTSLDGDDDRPKRDVDDDKPRRDEDRSSSAWRRDPPRDRESRDFGRRDGDRDFGRRDGDRDFGRRDGDRDFGRRDGERDFGRRDGERDFGRRDGDRDFGRRDGDRDFGRRDGDRDFGRRDGDRDFGRRDGDRDFGRRDGDRDFGRRDDRTPRDGDRFRGREEREPWRRDERKGDDRRVDERRPVTRDEGFGRDEGRARDDGGVWRRGGDRGGLDRGIERADDWRGDSGSKRLSARDEEKPKGEDREWRRDGAPRPSEGGSAWRRDGGRDNRDVRDDRRDIRDDREPPRREFASRDIRREYTDRREPPREEGGERREKAWTRGGERIGGGEDDDKGWRSREVERDTPARQADHDDPSPKDDPDDKKGRRLEQRSPPQEDDDGWTTVRR